MDSKKILDATYSVIGITASAVTIVIMIRIVAGPDKFRELSMRAVKATENQCQRRAMYWANMADESAKMYDSLRNVTL